MTDDDLIDVLGDIGLTEYQSRAYVASVRLGTTRYASLADEADIPQQRIYDVVEDLEELGLVEVQQGGDGKQAVPVDPERSLTELREQHVDEFSASVRTAIDSLEREYAQVDSSLGFVTVVSHESSVRRHVGEAIEDAEWVLFLSMPHDWYRDLADEVAAALDRGVSVQLLAQADDRETVAGAEYPAGLDVRHRPSADLLVAADRSYGIFRGVAAPPVSRPALVTADENFVEMLQRYRQQFWAPSAVVRTATRLPRRYLDPWSLILDLETRRLEVADPVVSLEGHEVETGRAGSWEGRLVDYTFEPDLDPGDTWTLPEVAQLEVQTDEGRVTVGGWDARLEDVAAHGLELREGAGPDTR